MTIPEYIDIASEVNVKLRLWDFESIDGKLFIDGMTHDEFMSAVENARAEIESSCEIP